MGLREMDGLIVRHLADLEEAGKRATVLEGEVFKVLGNTAEKWAVKEGWHGEFDIDTDGSLDAFWLAPLKWKLSEKPEEDWLAYFEFNAGADDDDANYFNMAHLCGEMNLKFGFQWKSDHFAAGRKAAWRTFINAAAEEVIAKTGFEHEKNGTFFLTVTIKAEALANAIEQDAIEDALGPFTTALDNLARSEPTFTGLLEAAKTHPQLGGAAR
jgi:hypothetical protein